MNKHSTVFFGLAVVVGLLLTAVRKELLKPWIWIAGVIALLIFLPNLIWQIQHNFPTLEMLRNVEASGKNVVLGPAAFVVWQVMMMHPILFPVWLAGLCSSLLARGARYRVLGWTYLVLLVTFIVLHGKNYYQEFPISTLHSPRIIPHLRFRFNFAALASSWVASRLALAVPVIRLVCFLPPPCLSADTCPPWMTAERSFAVSPDSLAVRQRQRRDDS